jgi:putative transferase (TIGR04331 family)
VSESVPRALVLGLVPDDFSPSRHLPIRTACFLGKEDLYQGWEDLDFSSEPFESGEEYRKADEQVCTYARELVDRIGVEFNYREKLDLSGRFWNTYLYPWVCFFVQSLWEQQHRVQNIVNHYRDEELEVELVADNLDWSFYTAKDFQHKGLHGFLYFEWITSRLLENVAPSTWNISYRDRLAEWKRDFSEDPERQPKDKKTYREKVDGMIHFELENYSYIYGMNPIDGLLINAFLKHKRGKSCRLTPRLEKVACQDPLADTDFLLSPLALLEKLLPLEYRRGISEIVNLEDRRDVPQGIKLGSQQMHGDGYFQLKRALAIEKGAKIIGVQHGGHGYGTAEIHGLTSEIEYGHEGFITWGWEEEGDCRGNFIPLPSPWLSKFMDRHRERTSKIILVGNLMNPFNGRYSSIPRGNGLLRYRKEKVNFVRSLGIEAKANFYYRPFRSISWALQDERYMQKHFPDVKTLSGNFHQELLKCRILVMDNPSTTLNLAMAANVPMLCFWNKADFSFCPQAFRLLKAMEDVEIYFDSAEKAANKLTLLGEGVGRWWQSEEVQQVRREWVRHYARTSKSWRKEWWKALKGLYE